jgi:hypothetical protein
MGCGASKSAEDSVVPNTTTAAQSKHATIKKNIPTASPVTVVVAATSTNNTKKISQSYGAPSPEGGLKGTLF